MRLILPFALALPLLLASCSQPNPQESDIIGRWEATSIVPYVLLDYRGTNDGHIVASGGDDSDQDFRIISLSNFVSSDDEFTLTATLVEDGEPETHTVTGQIFGSQLLLNISDLGEDDEFPIWFTRTEIFDASRDAARAALDTYRISTN